MNTNILKSIVLLNIISFFFSSCAPVYIQTSGSNRNNVYNVINSYGSSYKANIYLDNNKEYFGENVKINKDSTSWLDSNSDKRIAFETERITKIIMREKIPYSIIGFFAGALGTYVAFRLIGAKPGHGHPDAGIIVYPGMIAGGIIGAIYGGSQNDKTVFLLKH